MPIQFQGGHTAVNKTKTPVLRKLTFWEGQMNSKGADSSGTNIIACGQALKAKSYAGGRGYPLRAFCS